MLVANTEENWTYLHAEGFGFIATGVVHLQRPVVSYEGDTITCTIPEPLFEPGAGLTMAQFDALNNART